MQVGLSKKNGSKPLYLLAIIVEEVLDSDFHGIIAFLVLTELRRSI